MSSVPSPLRRVVWERAVGRCEYCLIFEEDFLAPHEPDHIIAEQHGGPTTAENLALGCILCNRRKGPNIASIDPKTGKRAFLFNPRQEKWSEHFKLESTRIVGLTASGRATVALLRLNLPERIESRELLMRAGRYSQADG
jgi:hypothetical protein